MRLVVNGAEVEVDDRHAETPLLWILRDVLELRGTKFGCGAGFCAACTVLIDGRNTKSCQTASKRAVGKKIVTVEGVSGPVVEAVRDAWYRGNVVQCGYCQPGQTLAAAALLETDPSPDATTIRGWMNGNICRCGTYPRVERAIRDAATTLASGREPDQVTARPEPEVRALTEAEKSDPVHPYIRVRRDGTITVFASQTELGQGIHTGLATIVAEELDADVQSIQVVHGANGQVGDGDLYGNPLSGGFQITGASSSTRVYWLRYRQIAAQARSRLVAAAAAAWEVPESEITIESGVISHAQSGVSGMFAEFAERAERLSVADGIEPKDPRTYGLVGRDDLLRVDAPAKILGKTEFTIDVALPGLLTAVVLHPPRFGAIVASIDDSSALGEPGVKAVVPIQGGVAVVAETFADAQRALRSLGVVWEDENAERRSSEQLLDEHRRLVESNERAVVAVGVGDVADGLSRAKHVIDSIYELPYLAHAAMEPNNAVCSMRDDGVLEVWAGTESPRYTQMAAAGAAGIDEDKVHVHVTYAGGSFGLHSSAAHDPTWDAVEVARALNWQYPIRLQSSREEDFKTGHFRPIAVHRVRVGADHQGRLTAFHQQIAAAHTSPNLPFVGDVMVKDGVDFFTTTGAADHPYTFPNFKLEATKVDVGVPTMVWRSVGNSHTEFARESALDELALAASRDPVDLRRELLAASPRTLRALELAAEHASWGDPLPPGQARGVASSGFLGHSAQVAEVSLDERNRIRIERIIVAVDCGITVNPDLVRAQVEGGLVFALSAAAWGEVVLGEGGEILTQNFDRYPVMRMQSMPQIEVHLIESTEPPTGVGELSVPSAAPALTNAIAALTGTRIRRLPINNTIKVA